MNQRKLIFQDASPLEATLWLTAALRDLHRCYPGKFITDVRSTAPALWQYHPHLTALSSEDPKVVWLCPPSEVLWPVDGSTLHPLDAWVDWINQCLGLRIRPTEYRGEVPLSAIEKRWVSKVQELAEEVVPFWILEAGGPYSTLAGRRNSADRIVRALKGEVAFVQIGMHGEDHPRVRGTIDLRGQSSLREWIRLIYHAQGLLTTTPFLSHLAAAVSRRHLQRRSCVTLTANPEETLREIRKSLSRQRRRALTQIQMRGFRRAVRRSASNGFDSEQLGAGNPEWECDQYLKALPPAPIRFQGRGIVICAGGVRYFTCAYVTIRVLRRLGCRLPIEVWYLGSREMTPSMMRLLKPYGVRCIDAEKVRKRFPCRRLGGWELKAFAMAHSKWAEVLFLDADNVPVRNPESLFEEEPYRRTGAVFWPDYGHFEPTIRVWEMLGMRVPQQPEFESGQMLMDKNRHWRPLRLALWFNEHSDFFYRFLHGDKETFHLAWRKLRAPFCFIQTPIHSLDWTMCQHDFLGRRLFQHRNMDKWTLHGTNPSVPGFWFEEECREYLQELRSQWDGNTSRLQSWYGIRQGPKRMRPHSLKVAILGHRKRTRARNQTLKEWRASDARPMEPDWILWETPPEAELWGESHALHLFLVQFLKQKAEFLLLLREDLQVSPKFWSALSQWQPWLQRSFSLASLYHPGVTETVCDVEQQVDWVEPQRLFTVQAVLLSRSLVSRCVDSWESRPIQLHQRLVQACRDQLIPFHHPSLVQFLGDFEPGSPRHAARAFDH